MAYLSRRIDEVGRYFLALEAMVGSGALGCVLERCLRDLEEHLKAPEGLEDTEELQSLIDAAVRLGLTPKKYKPLQERMLLASNSLLKYHEVMTINEVNIHIT